MNPAEARAELLHLLEDPPGPFPLDRAALLLAVDEYPRLDFDLYEQQLDGYARRVEEHAPPFGRRVTDPRRRLGALRQVLFEDTGFHGNREDFYDIRNSYLNEVLDRKLGIPISLAVLVLGVARRLGWPLLPVNFPNHFLLRYDAPSEPGDVLVVDPFHGGLILSPEELDERWRLATGYDAPEVTRMLEAAEPAAVLLRMLRNIQHVHVRGRRFRLAATATEKIALIDDANPQHERDLGHLLLAAKDASRAVHHLESYLSRAPHASDAETVRDQLRVIRTALLQEG